MEFKLNKKTTFELILNSTGLGMALGMGVLATDISFNGISKETAANFLKYPVRGAMVSNMVVGSALSIICVSTKICEF